MALPALGQKKMKNVKRKRIVYYDIKLASYWRTHRLLLLTF